jgi:hypothetical protein
MLKIRYLHLLLALMICPVSTVHAGSAAASIQATAHVEPSLGLTEARMIESEPAMAALDLEPGSHLFWLYGPKPSGVTVSIESLMGESGANPETTELRVFQEYPYVSLVGLDRELMAPEVVGGDVLITIIYTDN